jgi:solute carrier family 25 (mitochondrial phosphate transporter), member 23/24/25/41
MPKENAGLVEENGTEVDSVLKERMKDAEVLVREFIRASHVKGDVKPQVELSWVNHAFGLFMGVGISKTVVQPLERFRMLMQTSRISNQRKYLPMRGWASFLDLYKEVGVTGLYRGNLVTIARSLPTCLVPFASYDAFKQLLYVPGVTATDVSLFTKFLVGGSASFFFLLVTYPMNLIRTRMVCDSFLHNQPYTYKSAIHCARNAIEKGGAGWKGLYRGFTPAVLWTIPYTFTAFTAYDELKLKFGAGEGLTWKTMAAGGIAAAYAEAIAFPLDTLQRRIIMDGVSPHYYTTGKTRGLGEVAMQMWHSEGMLGFYKGLVPNMARKFVQVGTMFSVYEYIKQGYSQENEKDS